jgi:polyphosphate kinase
LLERVRFLSIASSNLDEFFEIRVAGIMQQEESASHSATREFLVEVLGRARQLVEAEQRCWKEQLVPALAAQGIIFKSREQLDESQRAELSPRFDADIFPALTPLAIDPSHPFPVLTNKGLYLLVLLRDPTDGEIRRAVVPVPRVLPRVLSVGPNGHTCFTLLSHVVQLFIHRLFPGLELQGSWAFRITRNSDLYVDEEEAGNLLEAIEDEIRNLRKGAPVRLEIEGDVPEGEMTWLLKSIGLKVENAFRVEHAVQHHRCANDHVGKQLRGAPYVIEGHDDQHTVGLHRSVRHGLNARLLQLRFIAQHHTFGYPRGTAGVNQQKRVVFMGTVGLRLDRC